MGANETVRGNRKRISMNQERFSEKILKRAFLHVLLSSALFLLSHFTSLAQTILFQDDFEDGHADGWQLDDEWQVEDVGGNVVLSGLGHGFAETGDFRWSDYTLQAKVNLADDKSNLHLNYRQGNRVSFQRYFLGFGLGGLTLRKQVVDTFTDLESVDEEYESNRWYTVEIAGDEGHIRVYLDGALKIDYLDSEPLLTGLISFESLPNSHVHLDDVVVTSIGDEPLSETAWESTGGPPGGLGYDVRIHPADKNVMFVTDNFAGVVKSDNGGREWYQTNSGISVKSGPTGDAVNIFSLTIDPNNSDIVWAGTNGNAQDFGVFKSTDGGSSWILKTNEMRMGSANGLVFRGLTVQEGNSDVVYAQAELATSVQGLEFERVKGRVYKTTNGGESWKVIWEGDNLARYLIIDPTNHNTLYLSTGIFDREAYNSDCQNGIPGGVGVLKSVDGGENWNPINNGLTDLYVGSLRMHPTNPQILFAGAGNYACTVFDKSNPVQPSGLFRTMDGGASWTKVGSLFTDNMTAVNFSSSNPDIVYAGSEMNFYRSEDGGLTWVRVSSPDRPYGPPGILAGVPIDVTIDPDNPDVLYANNYGGGVVRSLDGAKTWEDWSKGYTGAQMHNVFVSPSNSSTVYAIGRSGPFVSYDYGKDWIGIANGDASFAEWASVVVHPTNSDLVLVSDEYQGFILRSIDGGSDFSRVLKHPHSEGEVNQRQGFKTMVFAPSAPNIVYAGLANEGGGTLSSPPVGTVIYKSTNAGATFSPMPSIIDGNTVHELVVDPGDSNNIYAATFNGVYKSTDSAENWTHLDNLGSRNIEALAMDSQQTDYILAGGVFDGIWISQDGGSSWTGPHNRGFNNANPYISSIAIDPDDTDVIYAADYYSGIYQSIDKGNTWSPFPDREFSGLAVRAVKDIAISDEFIYAATEGGGVFRYERVPVAIAGVNTFYLPYYQAQEGSFTGFAVANYSIQSANIQFRVYDVNGTSVSFPNNPAKFTVDAGSQLAKVGHEIFGAESSTDQAGWVELTTDNPEISSFFQFGTTALTQLDGSVAFTGQAKKFYLPRVFDGPTSFRGQPASTFVSIANPNAEPISLQLTLHPIDQALAATRAEGTLQKTRTIPGKGFFYESISEIFNTGIEIAGGFLEVEVTEGEGAIGFELIQLDNHETIIGLNASFGNSATQSFSAQLASQEGLFTNVNLINTTLEQRTVTLTAVGSDGTNLADPVVKILAPEEQWSEDARSLFDVQAESVIGSLRVESDGNGVIGDVIFGDPVNFGFAASLPLQTETFTQAVFGQVANMAGFITGLALYNPGQNDTDITIEVISAGGEMVGQSIQPLGAGLRLSKLVPELVPTSEGQVGGYIRIRSDQPVIGQLLFGALGFNGIPTFFSAVPPTVIQ